MLKDQTMTKVEMYEKISIPAEHRPDLSEQEQNSLALEKFENRLSEKGKNKLKILRRPRRTSQNERVVLVFSIFLEIPDNSALPVPELQKQIKTAYFNAFPDEWDLSYINRKIAV